MFERIWLAPKCSDLIWNDWYVGHEVWDALESDISISVLVSGGVSAVGLMVLLSINARSVGTRDTQPDKQQQKQQQRITASPKAIQVERSISLFLTVLLMAAWMFLNWCVPHTSYILLLNSEMDFSGTSFIIIARASEFTTVEAPSVTLVPTAPKQAPTRPEFSETNISCCFGILTNNVLAGRMCT